LPLPKALLYGLLIGGFFFGNGVGTINRSKFSYLMLLLSGVALFVGGLVAIIHLLTLFVSGSWRNDYVGLISSLIGAIQFALASTLMCNLLSKETRFHCWPLTKQDVVTLVTKIQQQSGVDPTKPTAISLEPQPNPNDRNG
jgi:hypothetical protein